MDRQVTKPCPSCGGRDVQVSRLETEEMPYWFVRCMACDGVCTITKVVRDAVVDQWNGFYCWNEIDRLNKEVETLKDKELYEFNQLTDDQAKLKYRFEQLFESYVRSRLEYSGSWGNLSQDRRREVMIAEIKAELGWNA